MNIFFDNCTSPVLATTLDGYVTHLGHRAFHIADLQCGRDAQDPDWIAFLEEHEADWIVFTGDGRIHKNKALRAVFRSSGLVGFVLAPAYQKTPMHQVASFLLWRWPEIEQLIHIVGGGALYKVPMNRQGKLEQLPL